MFISLVFLIHWIFQELWQQSSYRTLLTSLKCWTYQARSSSGAQTLISPWGRANGRACRLTKCHKYLSSASLHCSHMRNFCSHGIHQPQWPKIHWAKWEDTAVTCTGLEESPTYMAFMARNIFEPRTETSIITKTFLMHSIPLPVLICSENAEKLL